jgi:hypothetical protein
MPPCTWQPVQLLFKLAQTEDVNSAGAVVHGAGAVAGAGLLAGASSSLPAPQAASTSTNSTLAWRQSLALDGPAVCRPLAVVDAMGALAVRCSNDMPASTVVLSTPRDRRRPATCVD